MIPKPEWFRAVCAGFPYLLYLLYSNPFILWTVEVVQVELAENHVSYCVLVTNDKATWF